MIDNLIKTLLSNLTVRAWLRTMHDDHNCPVRLVRLSAYDTRLLHSFLSWTSIFGNPSAVAKGLIEAVRV